MSDCCAPDASDRQQRGLLMVVLALNAIMFFVEFSAGWLARSSGLMADSLDMLADALVYGLSLYAVGKGISARANAALVNGYLQLLLGVGVLVHLVWRIWQNSIPEAETMTLISVLALIVNASCFGLLYRFRSGDINLRASWICSRNDMIANVGVMVAAALVAALEAPWPDWLIAAAVAAIVIRSALSIIREARHSLATGSEMAASCCGASCDTNTPSTITTTTSNTATSGCCSETPTAPAVASSCASSACGCHDEPAPAPVVTADSCCSGGQQPSGCQSDEKKAEPGCNADQLR